MLYGKIGQNWISSLEKMFFFVYVFSLLRCNDRGHYLNKFVSPLPRDALCQDWIGIGPVVLEK